MLRRRTKREIEKARARVAAARRAAEAAAQKRAEVEAASDEIMDEAEAHRLLLRANNFAANLRAALGGGDP